MVDVKKLISGIIIVLAIFSGVIIKWQFDKDYVALSRDDKVIAKEKWVVEAERTWFSLQKCHYENDTRICKDDWYAINIKCPKVETLGGHRTAIRCYYPNDYYEQLSRSLINTRIDFINLSNEFIVIKSSPQYKYGTRGAYAGYVTESFTFNDKAETEEEFPKEYIVNWDPKDTRNYRLIWRIENIKGYNEYVSDECRYIFDNVKINLKDECDKLDKVVIDTEKNRIWFYFKNQRGKQTFDVSLVDPPKDVYTLIEKCDTDIVTKYDTCKAIRNNGTLIEYEYDCNPYEEEVKINCVTLGIKTKGLKIECPSNYKCDIIDDEFCIMDCNDADCNYDINDYRATIYDWSKKCVPIDRITEGNIKVAKFKKSEIKAEQDV